ncbi:MAG: hypothetical protein Q8877_03355, partial [Sweet potato little leaf phytoplasma]|nr:hypothetical protein [Sweet potato little leaf phytoplasma]
MSGVGFAITTPVLSVTQAHQDRLRVVRARANLGSTAQVVLGPDSGQVLCNDELEIIRTYKTIV